MTLLGQLAPFVALTCWLCSAIFLHLFLSAIASRVIALSLIPWSAKITRFSTDKSEAPITHDILTSCNIPDVTHLSIEYTYTYMNNDYKNDKVDKINWMWPYCYEVSIHLLPIEEIKMLEHAYENRMEISIYVHKEKPWLSSIYKEDIRGNRLLFSPVFIVMFYFLGSYSLSFN
jgi:hypothetical protein